MKKIFAVFIVMFTLILVGAIPVCGDAFSVSINGSAADFTYAPIVNNDTVYMEVKELLGLAGSAAEWDAGKGVFVGSLEGSRLVFMPGQGILKIDNQITYLKDPLLNIQGNIYVSLEEFAVPLNFNIHRDKYRIELSGNLVFKPKNNSFPHYDITAVYADGKIYGSETIRLKNLQDKTLQDLLLVLPGPSVNPQSRTKILSVAVDGVPAEYQENETYLKIVFPRPIKPAEECSVNISFDTLVPEGPSRLGYTQQCAVLSCWYPVVPMEAEVPVYTGFGEPYSFQSGTYTVDLTVESGLQVFSGLEKIGKKDEGEGTTFAFSSPLPIREAAFVVGNFQTETRQVGDTTIYYAFQQYNPEIMPYAAGALERFGQWWGTYPYPILSLVDVPLEGFHGMEYGGMLLFSSISHPNRYVVVHEIAHQWWQGLVGNNQETEAWIDEGLASYSTLLYFEEVSGESYYSSKVHSMEKQVGKGFRTLKSPLMNFSSQEEYKKNAYTRGCLVWHEVREKIGREKLILLLRSIQEHYKHGQITTEDILFLIEEAAPGALAD